MINYLKDCQRSTAIGRLPEIINHNNDAIESEFNWFFDSSLNRLTKSVYAPTGSVKAHFGEFVNLNCEYITIKNIDSLRNSIETAVVKVIEGEEITHNTFNGRFFNEGLEIQCGSTYMHDADSIIYDSTRSLKDVIIKYGENTNKYFAENTSVTASGNYSHAGGLKTIANNTYAFSYGSGSQSPAIDVNKNSITIIGNGNANIYTLSGIPHATCTLDNRLIEGALVKTPSSGILTVKKIENTSITFDKSVGILTANTSLYIISGIVNGYAGCAIGNLNSVASTVGFAVGDKNRVGAYNGIALGTANIIKPNSSYGTAIGQYNIVSKANQTVIGKYNAEDTNSLFVIGNGIGEKAIYRKNVLTVDQSGNTSIAGDLIFAPDSSLPSINTLSLLMKYIKSLENRIKELEDSAVIYKDGYLMVVGSKEEGYYGNGGVGDLDEDFENYLINL